MNSQPPEPARSSFGPFIGMLLGLLAWAVGFVLLSSATDADDPTTNYFAAVALAIVGATFFIMSALYDIAGRD